jgi:hypothetical protein
MAKTKAPLAVKEKDTALTKQQKSSVATLLAFLQPQEGFDDNPLKSDLKFPTAKLMQSTSDEMKDRELIKANPHISFSAIINSMTKEQLPEEFIPAFLFRSWIRFNGRKEEDRGYDSNFAPGALIWKSNDYLDPRVKEEASWGPAGEQPLATAYMNYLCYFPGVSTPVVIGFARTSYPAGQDLFNLVKSCPTNVYRLTSDIEDKGKGSYAIFKVNISRKATQEELDLVKKLRDAFYSRKENIEAHDQVKAEGESTGSRPY